MRQHSCLSPPGSAAPRAFAEYIKQGRVLAHQADLHWDIKLDATGVALKGHAWDLRRLLKDGHPAPKKLKVFSSSSVAIEVMIAKGYLPMETNRRPCAVSVHWQDFIKAYALNHLLVIGRSVGHLTSTCAMLRTIATVLDNKLPWLLNADDIRRCMRVAAVCQPSGIAVQRITSFINTVVDAYHLAEACPLYPLIASERGAPGRGAGRSQFTLSGDTLRERLSSRKTEHRLPERRAFWELMRIVFTEKPRTFADAIRFAQVKCLAITGLRIGEVSFFPRDWKRTVEYRDHRGRAAGAQGGFSTALRLRYFAEKQGSRQTRVGQLCEANQFVPSIFEQIMTETLEEVERLTAPMRRILKAQCQTGRIFPMYAPDALIPAERMYLQMTGNVLVRDLEERVYKPYFERYRETFDLSILDELLQIQRRLKGRARQAWRCYSDTARAEGLMFRSADGAFWVGPRPREQYLRVDDVEEFLRAKKTTSLSDTKPSRLGEGREVAAWEFLFLVPKHTASESAKDLPCHVGKYVGVGISSPRVLSITLRPDAPQGRTLFSTYGQTDEDRALTLTAHSLRHLQNTELFRLGVADTIITKRFNRTSVAQTYEYDHRSLAEELEQITLPDEWESYLGPKAATVAKLIEAGRANGPIVRQFKTIQLEEGDEAAYQFLKAEADGFHATPYGHCLNSFTVDPCPTHLECFNNCRHLSATDLPENRRNLLVLHGKLKDALEAAEARSTRSIGRDNQIRHAQSRITAIARILDTPSGERVFPDGDDLSLKGQKSVVYGA